MRVLSFTTLYPNPGQPLHGVFVKHRLDRLRDKCEVQVVAPVDVLRRPGLVMERGASQDVIHPWYALVPKWFKHRDGEWLFRETWPQIRRALPVERFDVVDVHYAYPDGCAGARLASVLGKPYVLSVRGSDLHVLGRCPRRRPLIAHTLRGAAAVVAVSAALAREAIALGADPTGVHVIPNGVDHALFHPLDRVEARRRLGWSPHGFAIISVGRLVELKGFDTLIEAVARLTRRGLDVRCYIVGEGAGRAALARNIARRGLADRVVLCGAVPQRELAWYYGAADVSALFSRSEGCPNVILEALACGTPVAATRVGGVPDLVADGGQGVLIDPDDAESAARGLAVVLGRRWDRDVLAASVAANEWSATARRHGEVLQAAVRGRR